jgi:Cu(I)/Ag(I) efflux system periplasmic protein CusF
MNQRGAATVNQRLSPFKKSCRQILPGIVMLPVLALSLCDKAPPANSQPKVTGPSAAVATTSYQGVGRVTSLDPKRPSIGIDHEEIKDLMPAMTMEFYVKDKAMLDGLKVGDHIEFTVDNGVGGLVITKITKK